MVDNVDIIGIIFSSIKDGSNTRAENSSKGIADE